MTVGPHTSWSSHSETQCQITLTFNMYRKLTLTACGPASNQHINQSLAMLHVTQPHAVCR